MKEWISSEVHSFLLPIALSAIQEIGTKFFIDRINSTKDFSE